MWLIDPNENMDNLRERWAKYQKWVLEGNRPMSAINFGWTPSEPFEKANDVSQQISQLDERTQDAGSAKDAPSHEPRSDLTPPVPTLSAANLVEGNSAIYRHAL